MPAPNRPRLRPPSPAADTVDLSGEAEAAGARPSSRHVNDPAARGRWRHGSASSVRRVRFRHSPAPVPGPPPAARLQGMAPRLHGRRGPCPGARRPCRAGTLRRASKAEASAPAPGPPRAKVRRRRRVLTDGEDAGRPTGGDVIMVQVSRRRRSQDLHAAAPATVRAGALDLVVVLAAPCRRSPGGGSPPPQPPPCGTAIARRRRRRRSRSRARRRLRPKPPGLPRPADHRPAAPPPPWPAPPDGHNARLVP